MGNERAPLSEPLLINGQLSPSWQRYYAKVLDPVVALAIEIKGTADEITATDNGNGTVTISIPDTFIPSVVSGTANKITVTDDGDGTITLSIHNTFIPAAVLGTANQITATNNGNGTITLSIPASPTFESLILSNIKTGATQGAAGAAAGELWATSGHASLPDNAIMIGT